MKGSSSRYFGARFNFEAKASDQVKFGLNMDASTRRASNKDNLITNRPVPTSSSFSSTSQNVGAISNTGVEFDVTVSIFRDRDLTWDINFNAAHNKGKLEKLNGVTKFLGGGTYETFKLEEGGRTGCLLRI